MTNKSKITLAEDLLIEALQLCQEVAEENNMTSHFNAYGKYGFDQLLGNGNKFDSSIFDLLEA